MKKVRPMGKRSEDIDNFFEFVSDDAKRWAEAFMIAKRENNWTIDDIDEGLMIGWFANAIEVASDVRIRRVIEEPATFSAGKA